MKRLVDQSLYEILEVPPDASTMEIERACARALELYGPGSLATYSLVGPEETALLKDRIEEAKRTLLDPEARARYDARLAAEALAAEAAVRIASTGSGAVAAGPQRPWRAPPTPTPPPHPERRHVPEPTPPEPEREAEAEAEGAQEAPPAARVEERPEANVEAQRAGMGPAAPAAPSEPAAPRADGEGAGEAARAEATAPPAPPPAAAAPVEPVAPPPGPAPILLKKEIRPEPREFPIPDGAVWSGEALRKVRESRGLSVREVCERTKITPYHLDNIEQERFSLLPAPVYLRGILVAVARELRLDGQKVARSYLERMAAAGALR